MIIYSDDLKFIFDFDIYNDKLSINIVIDNLEYLGDRICIDKVLVLVMEIFFIFCLFVLRIVFVLIDGK